MLQQFCSVTRHDLSRPFSVGGHTYATDGSILVRTPRLDGALPYTGNINPERFDVPLRGFDDADFVAFGHVNIPAGIEGAAKTVISTDLCGQLFDFAYIELLIILPGLEVAPKTPHLGLFHDQARPLLFRFSGGIGALMPLSGRYGHHVAIDAECDRREEMADH